MVRSFRNMVRPLWIYPSTAVSDTDGNLEDACAIAPHYSFADPSPWLNWDSLEIDNLIIKLVYPLGPGRPEITSSSSPIAEVSTSSGGTGENTGVSVVKITTVQLICIHPNIERL
jgi:hypothetical protein